MLPYRVVYFTQHTNNRLIMSFSSLKKSSGKFADLTKEITKDVIGQKIFYYKVREDLTNVHDVYEKIKKK